MWFLKLSYMPLITCKLEKFRNYQKVQQAVLTYLATQLSEKEISSLRVCFMRLDKNGDGILSMTEIEDGLKNSAMADNFLEIAQSLDTNDSGYIDYNGNFLNNKRVFSSKYDGRYVFKEGEFNSGV